jgi:hypothetical protein
MCQTVWPLELADVTATHTHIDIEATRLSRVMMEEKVTGNPKPQLKHKQSKHGTKWI